MTKLNTIALRATTRIYAIDTCVPDDELLMSLIDTSSRENYLEWVREWKQAYKHLSDDIRAIKRRMRTSSSEPEEVNAARNELRLEKAFARGMLALRALGKHVSHVAYLNEQALAS